MEQKITPFLWFDDNAEEAMNFYTSVFKNSRIVNVSRNTEAAPGPDGAVLVGEIEIEGMRFLLLNGGPIFKFNESVSFMIHCEDQAEVDYFWNKLTEGGEESQCGWLKDKFGLSWQVTPKVLVELLSDPDREKANRVMAEMMKMGKIVIQDLEAAAAGSDKATAR